MTPAQLLDDLLIAWVLDIESVEFPNFEGLKP